MYDGNGDNQRPDDVLVVPDIFSKYIDAAVVRVGYLHPDVEFSREGNSIRVASSTGNEVDSIRRDVLYAVYREKIFADTLSMRTALLGMVSKR